MAHRDSPALPIAYVMLRILIVLNWIGGAAILALLVSTFVAETWTLRGLGIDPGNFPPIMGLRAIAVLGIVAVPFNYTILRKLVQIVETVRQGDPFVAANAYRLQSIAIALLCLQLLSMVIGFIGEAISRPKSPITLDAGFSLSGWLAVFLTFVLARIFAEGALMREDLRGTI
jgi:hypothetical protein